MPKFFCDYCDVYLTHDSMSVRKAHNSGRNHLRNVVDYYQQIGHEKAQSVIDSITNSYTAEGQQAPPMTGLAPNNMPPGFPPAGGFPPGFAAPFPGQVPPPGMPPLPPGFPAMPGGRGMPPGFPPVPNGFPPGFNQPGMPPSFPLAGSPGQGQAGSPPTNMPFPPPGGFPPNMPPNFQAPGGPSPPPGVRQGGPPTGMRQDGH